MARRNHAAEMVDLGRQFRSGKKHAVLYALLVCACSYPQQKPVPRWAQRAFGKAMHDVFMVRATSWDDVFGKPHSKRKIAQIRQKRALQWKIVCRVIELRRQKPKPKPADIFRKVADEERIGRPTVKRYFDSEVGASARAQRNQAWAAASRQRLAAWLPVSPVRARSRS
jgi:hypothetical protein